MHALLITSLSVCMHVYSDSAPGCYIKYIVRLLHDLASCYKIATPSFPHYNRFSSWAYVLFVYMYEMLYIYNHTSSQGFSSLCIHACSYHRQLS